MITREAKEQKIKQFAARVDLAQALIIAENTGLTAADMEALRSRLTACQAHGQVVKNTLARRVLKDGKFKSLHDKLSGPLVYGVGQDAAALAKAFVDTSRENEKLIIRGGALSDAADLDAAGVVALSSLPGRQELLGMVAGAMQAPIASFVRVLNEVPASFVRALAAVRDQKK